MFKGKIKKNFKKIIPKKFTTFYIYIIAAKYIDAIYFKLFIRKLAVFHYNEKCAYLEIYKCACSSIKKTLTDKKETRNSEEVKKLDKFTFIRNPFSKLYSCYNDKFKKNIKLYNYFEYETNLYLINKLTLGAFHKNDSFSDFVKKVAKIRDPFSDAHFKSQHCYVYQNNRCLVNYIGRFENLAKDFEPIRKKYNLRKLGHHNKSQKNKDDWKKFYTKELAGLVYQRYKKDFDLWYPKAYQELLYYLSKNAKKEKTL